MENKKSKIPYCQVVNAPVSEWHPRDLPYRHPILDGLQVDDRGNVQLYKGWYENKRNRSLKNRR